MAVVIPNVDVLKSWAQENQIPGTLTVLCNNFKVKKLVIDDMVNWGKLSVLKSFEQVSFENSAHSTRDFIDRALFQS